MEIAPCAIDRTETAALSVQGVDSVAWNEKTGELRVKYNKTEADNIDIYKKLSDAGHDTEILTAID
ncbi:MAG: hypothetical protein ACOCW8_01085 [bacterium]